MTNEQHELSFTKHSTTKKNNLKKKFVSINIKQNQSNQKRKKEKKNHASLINLDKSKKSKDKRRKLLKKLKDLRNVFNKYKSWKHLFREKMTTKALFKHQSWNYEIKFKLKKRFTFEFIYKFFNEQLTILRDYLKKNFIKKFFRKF